MLSLCVFAGIGISLQVSAQRSAHESFVYPVGALTSQGTASDGWKGAWIKNGTEVSVVESNLGDDLEGNSVEFPGVSPNPNNLPQYEYSRLLSEPWPHDGSVYWLSFYIKRNNPENLIPQKWGGLSLFDGSNELLFIGAPWEKNVIGFDGDEAGRQSSVSDTLLSYIVVKLETLDGGGGNAYMWINYTGELEPNNADAVAISPYPRSGANKSFNKIRIAADVSQSMRFDMINLGESYKNFGPNESRLSSVKINNSILADFDKDISDYLVKLPVGTVDLPIISATSIDAMAEVSVQMPASLPGSATISVIARDGTTKMVYNLLLSVSTTSVTDMVNNDFSIFPNPAKDQLFIKGNGAKSISICNLNGQVIKSMDVTNNLTVVNLNSFPKGIYIVKTIISNGSSRNERLIVE